MSRPVKTVAIFSYDRQQDQTLRERLVDVLQAHGVKVQAFNLARPDNVLPSTVDLVISIGGDGTLLQAVQQGSQLDAPFAGINTGSLGFLQVIDGDQIGTFCQRITDGDYSVTAYPLLDVTVEDHQQRITDKAFNDVVVEREGSRTVRLDLTIDGYDCGKVLGDGLIISTPLGSTAYTIAAGGAVIHPRAPVIEAVPLNPHDSKLYKSFKNPLVLPDNAMLVIQSEQDQARRARVVVDGRVLTVDGAVEVRVQVSQAGVSLLRMSDVLFWPQFFAKLVGSGE